MVRKVMFICAHNQTRSVAGEALVKGEEGFEVRSRAAWRGTARKLRPSDCDWADEIYIMMPGMKVPVVEACPNAGKKVRSLWIPDTYGTCQTDLLLALKTQLKHWGIDVKKSMEQARKDCWEVTEQKLGWGGFGFGKEFLSPTVWTWEPPSEEEIVALKRDYPETVGEEILRQREGKSPEWEYPYFPEWHLQEGARKMQKKYGKGESLWESEVPREEKLRMFEEGEAYVRRKEAERLRMMQKEQKERGKVKREQKMLEDLRKYTRSIKKLFEG